MTDHPSTRVEDQSAAGPGIPDVDPEGRDQGQQSAASDAHRLRRGLISTVVLAALLLAIAFAVPGLNPVLHEIGNASPGWLVAGVVFELLSCVGYVMVVRLILRRGPPRGVRLLAWAEMAFGAVVPAGGAGSLAVGVWAMRAWHVDAHRIAERSAVLFMLTSAINVIVLLPCGLLFAAGVSRGDLSVWYGLVPAAVAAGCLVFFGWLPTQTKRGAASDRRFARWMAETGGWVAATEKALLTPDWRLLGAFAYLLCDMAVLVVCLHALGLRAPIFPVLLGYQIGLMANIIPNHRISSDETCSCGRPSTRFRDQPSVVTLWCTGSAVAVTRAAARMINGATRLRRPLVQLADASPAERRRRPGERSEVADFRRLLRAARLGLEPGPTDMRRDFSLHMLCLRTSGCR